MQPYISTNYKMRSLQSGTHKETDKISTIYSRSPEKKSLLLTVLRLKKGSNHIYIIRSEAVGAVMSGETKKPIKPTDAREERDS